MNVISYELLESVILYQTAVVRRDFGAANELLPTVPKEQYNAIARFLEGQGLKEEALAVSTDADQKFELALQLGKLGEKERVHCRGGVDAPTDGVYNIIICWSRGHAEKKM